MQYWMSNEGKNRSELSCKTRSCAQKVSWSGHAKQARIKDQLVRVLICNSYQDLRQTSCVFLVYKLLFMTMWSKVDMCDLTCMQQEGWIET
jgi:hypothetical protein